MFEEKLPYLDSDREASKILADFLPDRIFDAHAHLCHTALLPSFAAGAPPLSCHLERYREEMTPLLCQPKKLLLNIIPYPDGAMKDRTSDLLARSNAFALTELEKDEENAAEVLVHPDETCEEIEAKLTHPRIRGLKCYHNIGSKVPSWDAEIGDYLPVSAWEVAEKHGLAITLHMVKDEALSHPANLSYIKEMAARYPNATLILAHVGRAFAAWTGLEAVAEVAHLDNVWSDFSGVCESPAMFQFLKKMGVEKCMWGSDYPVCRDRGKAISLGRGFYWIYQKDLDAFQSNTALSHYLVGTENLLAVRQAFLMAELGEAAVEDFFYNNAMRLFRQK